MDEGGKDQKKVNVRRSSRSNIGQQPSRYGDFATDILSSYFTSTQVKATDGTPMKRTTLVAPLKTIKLSRKRAEDDATVSSNGTGHSIVDLLDEEIDKLEKTVSSKVNLLKSLREMRNDQENQLLERIKEEQYLSELEEGEYQSEDDLKLEEPLPSAIAEGAQVSRYVETPRTHQPRRKMGSTPTRPRDPPPPPPKVGIMKRMVQQDNRVPVEKEIGSRVPRSTLFGNPQLFANEVGNPRGQAQGNLFGGRPRQGRSHYQPPPQSQDEGVNALAGALVQALQLQNRNTQQFVARQSTGSSLPLFTGNPLEWPLFAHHFIQSTQDCGFTPQQNMARLEKALRGEARRTVRSLMIIPTNTMAVMQRLEQRFGRPEIVIQALVEIARKTTPLKEGKLSSILDYSNAVNNLVTTVKTLGEPNYLENPQLLHELIEKLPDVFKIQWGMRAVELNRRSNLEDFAEWIDKLSDAAGMVTIPKLNIRESKRNENLFAASEVDEKPVQQKLSQSCFCCKKDDHYITNCDSFKKKTVQERWDFARSNNLCFRCLRIAHSLQQCRVKNSCRAEGCGKKHHTLLHGNKPESQQLTKDVKVKDMNATISTELSSSTLLRILCVTLYGPTGEITVNALLDEGSTVTLLSADVAKKLGLLGVADPLRIKWTNGTTQEDNSSNRVDCFVGPVGENEKFKLRKVRTLTNLMLPAQRTDLEEIVKKHPHLLKQKFKWMPGEKPLILIGQPHIKLTVAREVNESGDESPILTKTKLGWVMHGPTSGKDGDEATFSCVHESDDDILHNLVKESFSLDSLGVKMTTSARSREDVQAEAKMKQVTRRVDNRWETGLLWRRDLDKLPSSRAVAERRFISIEKKLARNLDLRKQYFNKIQHYIEKGYARKLTPEELAVKSDVEWYLPHFDATHPNKPGKIRIVFDAASRSNGVCLNDFLLTGPDLLVSLPGVLIQFCQKRIAIGGDIAEMFHQILIRHQDCPAQRFLWREEGSKEISVMQLLVMMFGSVCSPFCAQYIKNENAKEFQEEFPEAVNTILRKHYMDDWLQSVETEEEAIQLIRDVIEVHRRGGMEIGKWISNSKTVLNAITGEAVPSESKDLAEWSEIPTERALGLHWIPGKDVFTFRVNFGRAGDGIATGERIPTKRAVLRLIMLVWDPLGFIGHYLVKARILLQEIWKSKIGWDDEIPTSMHKKWKAWIGHLPDLGRIRIARCYSPYASQSCDVTLHIFTDSSELAGCCVSYLRIVEADGQVAVSFVMSRSRVAPLKPCFVPRLELNAALLASRMGKFILSQLEIKVHQVYYWTDSMTVLRWIRSEARRFQTYVAGRVGEIQENSEVCQWNWVPTAENPADDGTREGKVNLKENCRWWRGPSFLKDEKEHWPTESIQATHDDVELELRKEFVGVIQKLPEFSLPDVSRFSKYIRIVRATAWMLAFIRKCKKEEDAGNHLDIRLAQALLFRRSQCTAYPDEMQLLTDGKVIPNSSPLFILSPVLNGNGVLKMKSRLDGAEENLRFPIILHPKDGLTKLLLIHYHEKFGHAGEDIIRNEVRQTFWIPQLRTAVRRTCRSCLVCRKKRAQSQPPEMGSLPDFRIQPQPRAFWICGMDYFGPMEVTIGRRHEKRYGVLFTCMNTRAVHLEIAHSLTTDSCIMAIRRMISRRGEPEQMFSDNGTNLRGAERELRQALEELDQDRITSELSAKRIIWNFIPPAAAHMGGSWERLVRSVKTSLSVILKCRAPREEVLETLFAEAEAIVNSRPLTDVPVDAGSPEALTPFHFLIGTSSTGRPPGNFDERDLCLQKQKQWRKAQALTDQFWKRWVKEYIPTLQRRSKWHGSRPSLETGDIVVVLDESLKRSTWPLGVITSIFPGKDGVVRVAEVKTATGIYRRPVTKLAKLDVREAEPQD